MNHRMLITLSLLLIIIPSWLNADDEKVKENVETRVKLLGADSFKVRKKASEDLQKMIEDQPSVVEFLQKHRNHSDPEVRMRIRVLLKDQPVELERQKPVDIDKLKSGQSGKGVKLIFKNRSKKAVKIYWVDYEGTQKPWRDILKPGKKFICDRTFETNIWLVCDENNKPLGVYTVGGEDCQIILRDQTKKKK